MESLEINYFHLNQQKDSYRNKNKITAIGKYLHFIHFVYSFSWLLELTYILKSDFFFSRNYLTYVLE